ncbi:MAG: aerotolerance regulator BatA, partial [Bacteroides sp.]
SKREEEYKRFALAAFLLVLMEILLRYTVLRRIP